MLIFLAVSAPALRSVTPRAASPQIWRGATAADAKAEGQRNARTLEHEVRGVVVRQHAMDLPRSACRAIELGAGDSCGSRHFRVLK